MSKGCLFIISGPSGVGKHTIVDGIRTAIPCCHLSVSCTTRTPRPGEVNGQDYYFVDQTEFYRMVEAGEFLEWAEFSGNLYGTPRAAVERKLARQHVLLEIEGKGARQVKRVMPKACSIFVVPPPPELEMLERRLRGRGTENEAQIAKRLAVAREEFAFRGEFDHEVINPDGKSHLAVQEVLAIISG